MRVTTLPVYSKLADQKDVERLGLALPNGWRLSQHQVETYEALTGGEYDVVINTAMTGDGKSLAAYLPVLTNEHYRAFGMYPTIELSRDQERQFRNYTEKFKRDIHYSAIWGAELTRLAEEYGFARRADALKERFENHEVILTNPDIFNLVMNYRYKSLIFSDQELPYSLCSNYNALIFDEFHIFAMPQIIAALTAMLYIHEIDPGHKFLFSSATPNASMIEMVKRSGLRPCVIEGQYATVPDSGYRQVLQKAELHLEQLAEDEAVEDWLTARIEKIAEFWDVEGRRPKGAIIVNSVAAARRITQMLNQALARYGISVGENTGLVDLARRPIAQEKDLVVGTSTIDVGIDFNINFLVFESTNAGTFLQRLGRLGRCRMGEDAFERYEAHALISGKTPWIYHKLVSELAARGVGEGDPAERSPQLRDAVNASFRWENDFENYAKRWGSLNAAHVLTVLEGHKRDGAYANTAARLVERYQSLLRMANLGSARKRYRWLADPSYAADRLPILDEVLAFRGSSPFQVLCWDATVEPPAFITYDLFALVQNAEYEVISLTEYEAGRARSNAPAPTSYKYVMKGKNDATLVVRVLKFNRERENLLLTTDNNLSDFRDQVNALSDLEIEAPDSPHRRAVNQVLKRQVVVSYVTRTGPRADAKTLRRDHHLPAFFPLYRVRDNERKEYIITFGKPALMLEAQMLGWRQKNVEDEPIIC